MRNDYAHQRIAGAAYSGTTKRSARIPTLLYHLLIAPLQQLIVRHEITALTTTTNTGYNTFRAWRRLWPRMGLT